MKMAKFNTYYTVSLFILTLLGLGSCKENEGVEPKVNEEETLITFTLSETPMALVRSDEESSAVNLLNVLVLEKEEEGEDYIYVFRKPASLTENNTFEVKLSATENRIKLYFIANVNDFSMITIGDSEDEVVDKLVKRFNGEVLNSLPMSGEFELENLPGGATVGNLDITLLRSVAEVQVKLKEGDSTLAANFRLCSLQAYRANPGIQVIPAADTYENGKVTSPTVPAGMENTGTTTEKISADYPGVVKLSGLYLPESEGYVTSDDQQKKATCLIVGGYYQDYPLSYYRIDFESENSPVGQILRNHRYNIVINSVSGPGTTHPEEAVSRNIKYAINDWTPSDHNIDL